ncbi:MAG: hypothetical protein IT168_11115 [Bryobacterales bacterium]|nr:hypothetical protein [Bryobacterales bacterium]
MRVEWRHLLRAAGVCEKEFLDQEWQIGFGVCSSSVGADEKREKRSDAMAIVSKPLRSLQEVDG